MFEWYLRTPSEQIHSGISGVAIFGLIYMESMDVYEERQISWEL